MIYLTPGFRKKLADDTRDYIATADITLASGEVLNLTNTEIWGDGFEVEDAVSDDENFTALGATVIGAATLVIDNTSGQYTQYDFMNADVVLKVALMIDDTTGTRKETVKMGTFRVDDTQYNEATISLSMLDYMEQFDRPYSLSNLSYPATLGAIVRDACTICAVRQNTLTFPHDDFEVQERPADESTTFREVLSWAATIAGCFAKVNRDGELVIKWFNTAALEDDSGTDGGYYDDGTPYYTSGDSVDGGSFNPWNTGGTADGGDFTTEIPVHYIGSLYQQNICVDDTVITGVDIEVEDKDTSAEQQKQTYSVGTDGYKIKVTNNPFLTKENAQQVVNWLGQQLVGLTFRKCNVTHTDDPAIEAGDVGFLYDSRQEEYKILITRQRFEIGSPQTIVCGCDTPSHNSATRFTEATKSYVAARKLLKEQVNQYEKAMEDLREDIENNAHGLYAEEIEDPDNPGSYIYCLHDKPSLEQSAVRIHVSTIGVAVTANATAQSPDWYAFRVNGDLLARVIQTMNLFFDYAHGGTLKLGGNNNTNGLLEIYAADGTTKIGSWGKDGFFANTGGKITSKNGQVYFDLDNNEMACSLLKNPTGTCVFDATSGRSFRMYNSGVPEYGILFATQVNRGTYNGATIDCSSGLEVSGFGRKTYLLLKENDWWIGLPMRRSGSNSWATISAANYTDKNPVLVVDGFSETYISRNSYLGNSAYKIAYEQSSAKRYKHDIKPIEDEKLDPHRLLKLKIVQFVFDKEHEYDDMPNAVIPGIIAEDVQENYPAAARYRDGKIESWDERRIIPGMLALIQEQDRTIKEQQARLDELEKKLENLTKMVEFTMNR